MNEVLTQDGTKKTDAAIRKATEEWVMSFSNIPRSLVLKLYKLGDDITEITPRDIDDFDTLLPMWGTMWSFRSDVDQEWFEDKKNLQAMAECGFRIYEQEDYGYIFGIDGAGYDFYEVHWIPLYKARGLKWHRWI